MFCSLNYLFLELRIVRSKVLIPSYIFETQVIQECCALGFKPYSQEIGENIWDS